MNKVVCLIAMAMMVMWLSVSCKKDADSPENKPPGDNEPIETQPHILTPITKTIGNNVDGYYEALPTRYKQNDKKYPILIYFHGSGQIGNGDPESLKQVLKAGTAKVLAEKRFPPNINVNGENFSLIVLMPQFRGAPSNSDVKSFVDYAKANYRIDPARVYLSGSSMGARNLSEFAATFPTEQTAIVPMAGALFYDLSKKAKNLADNKVAVWVFHNENDRSISDDESINFVNAINSFNPAIRAKLTLFPPSDSPEGHDAWTTPTNPDYREGGKNIYEWMLQYKK
jgi:predicted peptidase